MKLWQFIPWPNQYHDHVRDSTEALPRHMPRILLYQESTQLADWADLHSKFGYLPDFAPIELEVCFDSDCQSLRITMCAEGFLPAPR